MIKIVLDKIQIDNVDLTPIIKYADWKSSHIQYLTENSGCEHYKLIAFIAKHFPKKSTFIDIGTYLGYSALALSLDSDNKVVSYDIHDNIPDNTNSIKTKSNIVLKIENCLYDMDTIKSSSFIVLDIDPHDGCQEIEMLNTFLKNNWKGIVLLDDINKNQAMKDFFDNIKQTKYDISKYGHFSGTGLVIFDESRFDIILK